MHGIAPRARTSPRKQFACERDRREARHLRPVIVAAPAATTFAKSAATWQSSPLQRHVHARCTSIRNARWRAQLDAVVERTAAATLMQSSAHEPRCCPGREHADSHRDAGAKYDRSAPVHSAAETARDPARRSCRASAHRPAADTCDARDPAIRMTVRHAPSRHCAIGLPT